MHEIELGPGADPAEFERLGAAVVHLFTVEHEDSPELHAYLEANPAAAEAWGRFRGFAPSTDVDTDHVVIAE